MERMQSKFRCNVKRDDVSVRSNLGPTFWTFSIIEERVADKVEIDIDDILNGVCVILPLLAMILAILALLFGTSLHHLTRSS